MPRVMECADLCVDFIFPHLTPRTLGLLACSSKNMRHMADDERVWKRQAVLAWNGFYYRFLDASIQCDSRAMMDQFLAAQRPQVGLREYPVIWIGLNEYRAIKTDQWREWDHILCALEMIGDGYKTLGWVETSPKQVVRRDLQSGGAVGMFGRKLWVEDAKDEWYDEVNALNSETESDYEDQTENETETSASSSCCS